MFLIFQWEKGDREKKKICIQVEWFTKSCTKILRLPFFSFGLKDPIFVSTRQLTFYEKRREKKISSFFVCHHLLLKSMCAIFFSFSSVFPTLLFRFSVVHKSICVLHLKGRFKMHILQTFSTNTNGINRKKKKTQTICQAWITHIWNNGKQMKRVRCCLSISKLNHNTFCFRDISHLKCSYAYFVICFTEDLLWKREFEN